MHEGVETVVMAKKRNMAFLKPEISVPLEIPLAESGVHAGFPSPADDFLEGSLDLMDLLFEYR